MNKDYIGAAFVAPIMNHSEYGPCLVVVTEHFKRCSKCDKGKDWNHGCNCEGDNEFIYITSIPGGKREWNSKEKRKETLKETAIREIYEETGGGLKLKFNQLSIFNDYIWQNKNNNRKQISRHYIVNVSDWSIDDFKVNDEMNKIHLIRLKDLEYILESKSSFGHQVLDVNDEKINLRPMMVEWIKRDRHKYLFNSNINYI